MVTNLIIEDEEGSTTVVPLGNEELTIGREEENTIQLTEQNISRHHARLFPSSDGWSIEDIHSYNGIKVNGSTINNATLIREGDLIQIGDYRLALSTENKHANAEDSEEGLLATTPEELAAPSAAPDQQQPSTSSQNWDQKREEVANASSSADPVKRSYTLIWVAIGLILLAVIIIVTRFFLT